MDKDKGDKIASVVLFTIVVLAVVVIIGGFFVYPAHEAGKVRDMLGENFTFEVQCDASRTENNSALLYSTIELPENFSNENNLVRAKIESVRSSFDHGSDGVFHSGDESDLYLGTKEDLLFIQNGSRLENRLIVPDQERLTVAIEMFTPIYGDASVTVEDITIEVIT